MHSTIDSQFSNWFCINGAPDMSKLHKKFQGEVLALSEGQPDVRYQVYFIVANHRRVPIVSEIHVESK